MATENTAAPETDEPGSETLASTENLYTPAMLAELLNVGVRVVRRWQRLGLLTPSATVMQLPYFDYTSLAIARQLATWTQQGLSVSSVRAQLKAFRAHLGGLDDRQADYALLEESAISADGKQLLLRRGDHLLESSGQLRMEFEDEDSEGDKAPTLRFQQPGESRSARSGPSEQDELPLQSMVEAAILSEDEGDFETAIDWYRAALASHGPNADVCFQIAELLYRQGDVSGARERYFMALELSPSMVEARANLGCVLAECGQLALAIAAFEGTLAQHPDYADVHFHLARAQDDSGNPAAAAAHWIRFLELAPASPWADEARERIDQSAPILKI